MAICEGQDCCSEARQKVVSLSGLETEWRNANALHGKRQDFCPLLPARTAPGLAPAAAPSTQKEMQFLREKILVSKVRLH